MSEKFYDAIVIGGGAAGSFAAKELTEQGLDVLMLEAGPEIGPQHFDPAKKPKKMRPVNIGERALATLMGQPVQSRAVFFRGMMRHLFVSDRDNPYTTPADAPFTWIRGRQAGGRTHTFGRVLMRWTDDDFRALSRTGQGVDWPVCYADMEPYYAEVERFLGLRGNADGLEVLPDGVYAAPAWLSPAEEHFKAAVESRWPERHVVSWRSILPAPDRVFAPMKAALASGRLTIRHGSIARRILSEGQLATGVEVIGAEGGSSWTARARHVVLAASPIESVRLMLNSASDAHPGGIGNSSGNLGRYFMDQIPMLAMGRYPAATGFAADETAPADPFYAKSGGVFLTRFDGGGAFDFQGSIGRAETGPQDPAKIQFFGFGQMQPHEDNRITLDPRKADRWGIPVPHVCCRMRAPDRALLKRQEDALIETVTGVGGKMEFLGSPAGMREWGAGVHPGADPLSRMLFRRFFPQVMTMGAAIHETGGARMGDDPATSVTDGWGRCWDMPNLHVTDAATFAGSGVSGTTLTIMAQTVRSCRHLAAGAPAAAA
ncbi:GMC oxidoreductase [Mangrovicoccus sp. HB161399]|uniref:GMC oxidoreductase n=1 Tax=Mangrovicoccus sp. HB161399 TaxID=2720392 RepID=UPI00155466DD|nr:GMC family oxidoreductase [Mangrovicoccus sp. HB161399]